MTTRAKPTAAIPNISLSTLKAVAPTNETSQQVENAGTLPHPKTTLRLLSAGFSFFVAGTNDGSLGALLPYILTTYHAKTSLIAIL